MAEKASGYWGRDQFMGLGTEEEMTSRELAEKIINVISTRYYPAEEVTELIAAYVAEARQQLIEEIYAGLRKYQGEPMGRIGAIQAIRSLPLSNAIDRVEMDGKAGGEK